VSANARKVDRLLAEAAALEQVPEADARRAAYWQEFRRRFFGAMRRILALVPDGDPHEDALVRAIDAFTDACKRGGWYQWWNRTGGLWDWHRSLVWGHSTIPDGMTEAAARENLARFLAYSRETMTRTCYGCGLAAPAAWAGQWASMAWQGQPPARCAHCGGTDLVDLCSQYGRPRPPWHDDWPARFGLGV
jgi:hypothetical protein